MPRVADVRFWFIPCVLSVAGTSTAGPAAHSATARPSCRPTEWVLPLASWIVAYGWAKGWQMVQFCMALFEAYVKPIGWNLYKFCFHHLSLEWGFACWQEFYCANFCHAVSLKFKFSGSCAMKWQSHEQRIKLACYMIAYCSFTFAVNLVYSIMFILPSYNLCYWLNVR